MEKVDHTGWHARTKYVEAEELRRPMDIDGVEWDDRVPTKLQIADNRDEASGAPDPEVAPVAAFAHKCLRFEQDSGVKREKVRVAFNAYAHDHDRGTWDFDDQGTMSKFGQRLADVFEDDLGRGKIGGERAYKHVTLTTVGAEYFNQAMEGFESSATPIRGEDGAT